MIIRAAIKYKDVIFLGSDKERHDNIIKNVIKDLEILPDPWIHGFINEKGEFLNRQIAAKEAFESGQLKEPNDCLMSEDLW